MDVNLLCGSRRGRLGRGVNPASRVPILLSDEKQPAPPRQRRSLRKRESLLAAARALFGDKGYDAASIEEITAKAGTAAGAFYTYFRSKRQLLIVLMNELVGRLSHVDLRPNGRVNVRAGLRKFLAAIFRTDVKYFGAVRAWQEAALGDAALGRMQAAIERWTHARILGVFRGLQRYPNARQGRDLPAFARMMDRHLWSLLALGSRLSPRAFHREVQLTADVIYDYLFDSAAPGKAAARTRAGASAKPATRANRRLRTTRA